MCGITGVFTTTVHPAAELRGVVGRMSAALTHRGPDDDGVWADAEAGIALGFRRLAIIDLSPEGHQPMTSTSGRFTLVFNGEVFNYAGLRRELEASGHRFRGHSDTEVMLAAFDKWGVEPAVRRFVGMFAFALWDRETRELHLVRDRLGIKPLYVFHTPGVLVFASELKALVTHPAFDRAIDRDALATYLRLLYVPAPATIYRGTAKLQPGHIWTIRRPDLPLPPPTAYWRLTEVARSGLAQPLDGSDDEIVAEADRLLGEAVGLRMYADVPLGAFLSGGIDSSLVVALMQERSERPVRTFTVGFGSAHYDESAPAAAVARHLGTAHVGVTLGDDDLRAAVPRLPELFDEPLADPSQLPTLLVSGVARREVTVALSGDGGDELFAGYNRYVVGRSALRAAGALPAPARRAISSIIGRGSPESWNRVGRGLQAVLPGRIADPRLGEKFYKLRTLAIAGSQPALYRSLVSFWSDPTAVVPGAVEDGYAAERAWTELPRAATLERMMLADQLEYLPDDLLAKVDRASMAVSLEARVPLLDHRVVEFSWRLPARFKVRNGQGKWLLRRLLSRRVPDALVDRPKMGFSVPIDHWLRGPLRPWAENLLTESRLGMDGLLAPEPVRDTWRAFLAGGGSAGLALWAVLVFQAWRDRWRPTT
ncbi:MAG: asparagine synthase (glutamine-hydrolyzing) [Gemmatimonadales bacterium]